MVRLAKFILCCVKWRWMPRTQSESLHPMVVSENLQPCCRGTSNTVVSEADRMQFVMFPDHNYYRYTHNRTRAIPRCTVLQYLAMECRWVWKTLGSCLPRVQYLRRGYWLAPDLTNHFYSPISTSVMEETEGRAKLVSIRVRAFFSPLEGKIVYYLWPHFCVCWRPVSSHCLEESVAFSPPKNFRDEWQHKTYSNIVKHSLNNQFIKQHSSSPQQYIITFTYGVGMHGCSPSVTSYRGDFINHTNMP